MRLSPSPVTSTTSAQSVRAGFLVGHLLASVPAYTAERRHDLGSHTGRQAVRSHPYKPGRQSHGCLPYGTKWHMERLPDPSALSKVPLDPKASSSSAVLAALSAMPQHKRCGTPGYPEPRCLSSSPRLPYLPSFFTIAAASASSSSSADPSTTEVTCTCGSRISMPFIFWMASSMRCPACGAHEPL